MSSISPLRSRRCLPQAPCRLRSMCKGSIISLPSMRSARAARCSTACSRSSLGTISGSFSGRMAEPLQSRSGAIGISIFPIGARSTTRRPIALIDEFEATFQRAVEIRLRADVPVVGYLSGGVDSAYVLATAAKVARRPLPSFTFKCRSPHSTRRQVRANRRAISAARRPWWKRAGVIADNMRR